jgi:hypothetical protein
MFANVAMIKGLGISNLFLYGGFIFLQVYALTEFMDRGKYAWVLEAVKNMVCISMIVQSGEWFGSNAISPLIAPVLIAYFVMSSFAVYYFSKTPADPSAKLYIVE